MFVHATHIHHARDGEKFKGSNNNGDCDLHERWREGLKENERYKEPNERRVRERERERDLTENVIRKKWIKTEESIKEKDRGLVSSAYHLKEEIPFIRRLKDQIMCWLVESKPATVCVNV